MPIVEYDGIEVEAGEPELWPLEWINFRCHPCTDHSGVQKYLDGSLAFRPILVCRRCMVVLDGWHRLAAAWRSGARYIEVQFTDMHLGNAADCCHVDRVNWMDTLHPWADLDCVSGSYLKSDFAARSLLPTAVALRAAGDDKMPLMRQWEHLRVAAFLGVVEGRHILDVGTRESVLPSYFAKRGATITAIDLNTDAIMRAPGITVQEGDARALNFVDESFDRVVCSACVKLIDDDIQAVREMFRVLKPHGLLAITFDFGRDYEEFPSASTGRRVYDALSIYSHFVEPLEPFGALCGPTGFYRSDWNDWPIANQAPAVFARGVNIQVGFVLIRKVPDADCLRVR